MHTLSHGYNYNKAVGALALPTGLKWLTSTRHSRQQATMRPATPPQGWQSPQVITFSPAITWPSHLGQKMSSPSLGRCSKPSAAPQEQLSTTRLLTSSSTSPTSPITPFEKLLAQASQKSVPEQSPHEPAVAMSATVAAFFLSATGSTNAGANAGAKACT